MILNEVLNKLGVTSKYSIELFVDNSTVKNYTKNDNIFTDGKKNESEYILLSGVLHRYNISEKGETVTTGFYMPYQAVTPHFARTINGKSIFTLQALTDVLIATIPVLLLDDFRHNNKEFNEFGQRIIESELSQTFYKEMIYRSFNAKERLLTLRKDYPNLENMIPHNIIASYLGITNVSLSRLRNELASK